MGELVPTLHRGEERQPERRGADGFPERAQSLDPFSRRIAGNQRRVDGPDRNAGHPVRVQIRLSQRLIDARLVSAQSTPALQNQCDALEGRAPGCDVRLAWGRPATGHGDPRSIDLMGGEDLAAIARLKCARWRSRSVGPRLRALAKRRSRRTATRDTDDDASNPQICWEPSRGAQLRVVNWAFFRRIKRAAGRSPALSDKRGKPRGRG